MANPIVEFSVDPLDGSGSVVIDIDNTDPAYDWRKNFYIPK
jgi:hypothetical protein